MFKLISVVQFFGYGVGGKGLCLEFIDIFKCWKAIAFLKTSTRRADVGCELNSRSIDI